MSDPHIPATLHQSGYCAPCSPGGNIHSILQIEGESGAGIITVAGVPASSDGEVGNFAIDTVNEALYGPKQSDNTWPGPLIQSSTSGSGLITVNAAEAIGGFRAIQIDSSGQANHADSSDVSHVGDVRGISEGAASVGNPVSIRYAGQMTDAGWSWTPQEPIYFDSNGVLTQTPPTVGFLQIVAEAITPTLIMVQIQSPVLLA